MKRVVIKSVQNSIVYSSNVSHNKIYAAKTRTDIVVFYRNSGHRDVYEPTRGISGKEKEDRALTGESYAGFWSIMSISDPTNSSFSGEGLTYPTLTRAIEEFIAANNPLPHAIGQDMCSVYEFENLVEFGEWLIAVCPRIIL